MKYDDAPKICPVCGNLLKYRDRRQRIIRTEDGRTLWCTVRRFKCTNCNRLHGYIRNTQQKILEKHLPPDYGSSYLRSARKNGAGWLHHVLCFVYNLGGFLIPYYEKRLYLERLRCTYLGSTVSSA